jgi:hypothetical protein
MVFLPARAIRAPEFAFACARTIETMPFKGVPMSLDLFPSPPAESAAYQESPRQIDRHERLVAVLATSLGVLIVAAIAVLMGMA